MNFLKTALFTLMLVVPSTTTPFQGFNQKTKKYVKAALYSVAALGSGYLAYCCLRDLYHPTQPDLNSSQVARDINEKFTQAKLDFNDEFNKGLDRGKEEISTLVLDYTSRVTVDIPVAIKQIQEKRNSITYSSQSKNFQNGIQASATIAIKELKKYHNYSYSPKDILGVLVGGCATIHFGHEAIRYLAPGDSVNINVRPHVANGTVQSSITAGFTINR